MLLRISPELIVFKKQSVVPQMATCFVDKHVGMGQNETTRGPLAHPSHGCKSSRRQTMVTTKHHAPSSAKRGKGVVIKLPDKRKIDLRVATPFPLV